MRESDRVIAPEELYEDTLSNRPGQWKNGDGQPGG